MDEARRFKILSELFDRARDLARPELESFLAEITDRGLREELASMVALDREGTVGVGPIIDIAGVLEQETAEPEFAVPERIGNYEILGLIGTGASGVVLRARQPETDRIVAIKVLGTGSWNPRALARFRREIRLLGRLDHPNIARIYEAGTDGEGLSARPYFVMEYVSGLTLVAWSRVLAERGQPMTDRLVPILDIFEQVVLAVGYAHANGVVHRDLKPANILVGANGRAKVLDFGVSGFLPETSASALDDTRIDTPTQSLPGHALTEQLVGTVPYMSPEQFDGASAVGHRSDLYALGVMLFECLAGELPYVIDRNSIPAAAAAIRTTVPPLLGHVDAALAGGIETVVAKLLEKDPADRYQSATELLEDVRRLRDGRETNARPITGLARARRRLRRGQWRASVDRWLGNRWLGNRWLVGRMPAMLVLMLLSILLVFVLLASGLAYTTFRWLDAEAKLARVAAQASETPGSGSRADPNAK